MADNDDVWQIVKKKKKKMMAEKTDAQNLCEDECRHGKLVAGDG